MQATTRNSLAAVAAGMAAGLVVWAVVRLLGPSYLADGISAVSLICMHIIVGVVLITGFMRAVPSPYGIADGTAGQRWHRG